MYKLGETRTYPISEGRTVDLTRDFLCFNCVVKDKDDFLLMTFTDWRFMDDDPLEIPDKIIAGLNRLFDNN